MQDLAVEPYVVIGKGENALYKFKNGKDLYTKKEFTELLRKSIKEGMKCETIEETRPTSKKDTRKKPAKN